MLKWLYCVLYTVLALCTWPMLFWTITLNEQSTSNASQTILRKKRPRESDLLVLITIDVNFLVVEMNANSKFLVFFVVCVWKCKLVILWFLIRNYYHFLHELDIYVVFDKPGDYLIFFCCWFSFVAPYPIYRLTWLTICISSSLSFSLIF